MTLLEITPDNQPESEFALASETQLLESEWYEEGIRVSYLHVDDISDHSESREFTQTRVQALQDLLEQHPEWEAPKVIGGKFVNKTMNPASAELYTLEALREWRTRLVPSAAALANLYRPDETHLASPVRDGEPLFNGAEIDQPTHDFFVNGLDAIAIRTRAGLMKMITDEHKNGENTRWVSLACGAGIPVLDAVGGNKNIKLEFVDNDPNALEFLSRLANEQSLSEGDNYSRHNNNLIRDLILSEKLVDELGQESADVVDMMGIVEYFSKEYAIKMLRNASRMVKPGGSLVFANMLSTRPQLDLNLRGIGWPGIYPRSLEEITDLVREAGLMEDASVNVYIPEDSVYAVIDVHKNSGPTDAIN